MQGFLRYWFLDTLDEYIRLMSGFLEILKRISTDLLSLVIYHSAISSAISTALHSLL